MEECRRAYGVYNIRSITHLLSQRVWTDVRYTKLHRGISEMYFINAQLLKGLEMY
jgi:hypothetical protein